MVELPHREITEPLFEEIVLKYWESFEMKAILMEQRDVMQIELVLSVDIVDQVDLQHQKILVNPFEEIVKRSLEKLAMKETLMELKAETPIEQLC